MLYMAIILANMSTSNNILTLSTHSVLYLQLKPSPYKQNIQTELSSTHMANETADIMTNTILYPKIIDLPIDDISVSNRQKVYQIWQIYWNSINIGLPTN